MDHQISVIFLGLWLFPQAFLLPLSNRKRVDDHTVSLLSDGSEDEEHTSMDVFTQILQSNKGSMMRLYHGDIAMNLGLSATKCTDCLWPKSADGKVNIPYSLSSDFTNNEKKFIEKALQDFTTLTCIQFVQRSTEEAFLDIASGSGCWSYIGKTGESQFVSVSRNGCLARGVIQHEVLHALGFYHEQSRSDRDNYVDIMWQYINEGDWENMEKIDTENLGIEYDYSSVMHYGRYAYSNTSGKATISPKPEPSVTIGQRYGLSELDVQKIKKLYDCELCSFLLTGINGSLESENFYSAFSSASHCIWLIRVNKNKALLQFDTFDVHLSTSCTTDYITVYDGASRESPVLLDRVCGNQEIPLLVASGNDMLVVFAHGMTLGDTKFKALYSSVDCGGTYTKDNGTVTSPGYPDLYPNYANCVTTLWAPKGHQIVLNFTFFDLELSTECLYDYLIINDGSRTTSPELGRFCCDVHVPTTVVSSGNVMLLQFHSDIWFNKLGYSADYFFVKSS
ncbi:embryonic protein UVS.2 [Bombina bombina]|uniref:embryonic protein UVS.2 n=1 Tax=Bombina bombina TaxID=8345 RepID=UPI00235A82E0|nr:embryonic protein UVS.2 [Bombina bombina]